jgi:hypothetical protein
MRDIWPFIRLAQTLGAQSRFNSRSNLTGKGKDVVKFFQFCSSLTGLKCAMLSQKYIFRISPTPKRKAGKYQEKKAGLIDATENDH